MILVKMVVVQDVSMEVQFIEILFEGFQQDLFLEVFVVSSEVVQNFSSIDGFILVNGYWSILDGYLYFCKYCDFRFYDMI